MSAAIVCGSGPGGPDGKAAFYRDLETATRLEPGAQIIGVNLTGLFLPVVHHVVSLHQDLPGPLRALRPSCDWHRQGHEPCTTWSSRPWDGVDEVFKRDPRSNAGTSSLFAVRIALECLNVARVILVGVPMDNSGRWFDPPGAPYVWPHQDDRGPWEIAARGEFAGRVTSMGGWTRELLGSPVGVAA